MPHSQTQLFEIAKKLIIFSANKKKYLKLRKIKLFLS
jgi:hypothetical protein